MDKNKVLHNINLLKDIPIFKGVSNIILQNILSNSSFINFEKNKSIFIQNEPAHYVYIIMEGSVKIFQSNEEGEEMVLKMINIGDSFIEAITFVNKNYPASAQAAEDVLVLSIPAEILRNNITKDNFLAINILEISMKASQELINKIEQLTLRTATQRVGWFLLRLFVEREIPNKTIELPYDKSLIASYLNMKPETLSRTLKELKKQGLNIEHNTVSISDPFTLCDYCSIDITKDCNQSTHERCKYKNDY